MYCVLIPQTSTRKGARLMSRKPSSAPQLPTRPSSSRPSGSSQVCSVRRTPSMFCSSAAANALICRLPTSTAPVSTMLSTVPTRDLCFIRPEK